MRFNLQTAAILAGCMALSAVAQDSASPQDARKVSYALGMNLALQIKRVGADVDVNTIARALKDVAEGKPTQMQESELRPIFRQEEAAARAKQAVKNKNEGEAFLAKNARAEGVTVLADGLQYQVIQEGAGESPKSTDSVVVNYRSRFVDGAEFDHREHFGAPLAAQIKGWQEALLLMKPGSKWRVAVPSTLAYGHKGMGAVGPDATVIFEIEFVSVQPSTAQVSDK